MRNIHKYMLAALLGGMLISNAVAIELTKDGKATAVIVLPDAAEELEKQAADELVEHIKLISGAELGVTGAAALPQGLVPIYLGAAAADDLVQATLAKGDNPSAFTLRVRPGRVDIRGLSAEGTLFGSYELLEQLGVRWYNPGDYGRVIPKNVTIDLAEQSTTQVPSFELRLLQPWTNHTSGWIARQRLGGRQRSTGAHGIPPFRGGKAGRDMFAAHPEYYALIAGERMHGQVCVSNPEVSQLTAQYIRDNYEPTAERFYVGMGPNDGSGYCECENCQALDGGVHDPFRQSVSHTGRYIDFFNRVLDILEEDYPQLHIVWYVYAAHMMPPPENIAPNPRIVGSFAPINMDRLRSMDNPMSPDRYTLRWVIEKWSDLKPNELYYRGYYHNLACIQLPKTQIDRVRNDIPVFHERGIKAMRVECISGNVNWDTDPLTLYMAARMMWDVNTDVDAVLAEFYRLFYGPAEIPMREYFEKLEASVRDTPWLAGSTYVYLPMFLDHPRRGELRAILDRAMAIADKSDTAPEYRARVKNIRDGYERMDLFLDMILSRNKFDFKTAKEKLEGYIALSASLLEESIEISPQSSGRWQMRKGGGSISYFNRFFNLPVVSGHERAIEKGKVVAGLADEWQFLTDSTEIGDLAGWYRPGELGGAWQKIKAYSRTWADQGLYYYKGVAWYRQKVEIPADARGKPVYLWFGGVDELAAVWVNGQYLGTNREPEGGLPGTPGTFRPFDLDATKAIVPGGENWVVVKAINRNLDELGTGGIMAPAMFWTPNDPNWKPE